MEQLEWFRPTVFGGFALTKPFSELGRVCSNRGTEAVVVWVNYSVAVADLGDDLVRAKHDIDIALAHTIRASSINSDTATITHVAQDHTIEPVFVRLHYIPLIITPIPPVCLNISGVLHAKICWNNITTSRGSESTGCLRAG